MIEIDFIICALDIEYRGIIKHFTVEYENILNDAWEYACCNNGRLLIVKSGIGKEAARQCTEYIINELNPSSIISAGIAGAISLELNIGDIVISNEIIDYRENQTPIEISAQSIFIPSRLQESLYTRKMICVDDIVNDSSKKKKLFDEYGALCVEMESAGIIKECNKHNIPFAAVKIINDHADGRAIISMMKAQQKVTDKLGQFLSEILKQKITGEDAI